MTNLFNRHGWIIPAMAAAFVPAVAHADAAADAPEGRWQVKAFISGVLPDGSLTKVSGPDAGMLTGANVTGIDNWVPTLALEYFITPQISLETICCATGHHMTGTGTLAGTPLVDNAVIMPFTLSAKYHFDLGGVRPYVGAGPALIVFASKRPSAAVQGLGLESVSIPAKAGVALQAGLDIPLDIKGFSLSVDAKRYFVRPTASFKDASGAVLLQTTHKLDPLVVSAGVGYRF